MLHVTECWAVKNQYKNKLSVAETRILRWMCGKTRRDRIINDNIREPIKKLDLDLGCLGM